MENIHMLFRTVNGSELESIYQWIQLYGKVDLETLISDFGASIEGKDSSSTNLVDALSFLETSKLITKIDGVWEASSSESDSANFRINLIRKLRYIQLENKIITLDQYFFGLVDKLFIQPNILFRDQLHTLINDFNLPTPCSMEKVNAWRRVLEFLGIGIRAYKGLQICYSPELVRQIINEWPEDSGPLQHFLEQHFNKYLPWKSLNDLAKALEYPLLFLERNGEIILQTKQDLPNRNYLGTRRIKWISKGGQQNHENTVSQKKRS